MLPDAVMTISFVFTYIWRLFNSFYIPGTNVTPAAFAILSLSILLVIKVLKSVLRLSDFDE